MEHLVPCQGRKVNYADGLRGLAPGEKLQDDVTAHEAFSNMLAWILAH